MRAEIVVREVARDDFESFPETVHTIQREICGMNSRSEMQEVMTSVALPRLSVGIQHKALVVCLFTCQCAAASVVMLQ